MLKENGAPPADGKWADIAVLEPVRDYKARHASTLLTFDAVVDAIGQIESQARRQSRRRNKLLAIAESCRNAPRLARPRPGENLSLHARRRWSAFDCRHLPTCSDYADQALDRFGLWAGGWMTLARLLRCQPWGTSGLDFVAGCVAGRMRAGTCRGATRRWRGTNAHPRRRMHVT